MSEQLIIVIGDLIKHTISLNHIKYEDQKLNLLLYAFLSLVVSSILKLIFNYDTFREQINYAKWILTYKIYNKLYNIQTIVYPCNKEYEQYSPFIMDKDKSDRNKLKQYELCNVNKRYFLETLGFRLEKHRSSNKNMEHACTYIYNFTLNDNSIENKPTKVNVTYATFNNYFESKAKDLKVIAFINGYYIFIDITAFNTRDEDDLRIMSVNREALDLFMSIVQSDINEHKELLSQHNGSLEIIEYDRKNGDIKVGNVKPFLGFNDYISKYKMMLLRKLDAFTNGNLYKNNCHFENNLGLLLHGTYGTGKTFLITAIANYLKRSIYVINFTKIKTKTEFRAIMSRSNIDKYIFSLDEIDYVLSSLLNTDKSEQTADIRFQIQGLSVQIAACNDADAKQLLIEKMKILMESGNSDELTYEFLLSELSGLSSVNGRIMIATTNFIDKIPKALLRPGRFDIVLHLGHFNDTEIKELLIKLYKPISEDLRLIKKTHFPSDKYTPAYLIMKANEYKNLHDLITVLIKNNNCGSGNDNDSSITNYDDYYN